MKNMSLAELMADLEPTDMARVEYEEEVTLREKLAKLLEDTAIALKGPEPPNTLWGWDDLPAIATEQRRVMQQIMQVIGPEAVCHCAGCAWETNETIRLLRSVGIEYQMRPHAKMVKHELEKEEEGNKRG